MSKISLRVRLTFITTTIIVLIAASLTFASMHSAKTLASDMLVSIDGRMILNSQDLISAAVSSESYNPNIVINTDAGHGIVNEPPQITHTITAKPVREFNRTSLLYMIIIVAAGSAVTFLALGQELKPIKRLSTEISSITENELATRVDAGGGGKEINHLAVTFNLLLDRLEKAFEEQKNFSTAAAHELKTPLAVLKTNIDVLNLEQSPSKDSYTQVMEVTAEQINRMSKLVDDLFNIYMKQDYDFNDEIKLADLVSSIYAEQKGLFESKGIDAKINDNSKSLLKGNAQLLHRALSNIIENAGKYNVDNGFIKTTINETDNKFEILITDSGIGISKEHLSDIFEPFFRVDASRSRKIGGAGLGLAISKSMIKRHSGDITAEADKNNGTVFRITL